MVRAPGDQERALRWVGDCWAFVLVCFLAGEELRGACGASLDERSMASQHSAESLCIILFTDIFVVLSQPGRVGTCCSDGFRTTRFCPAGEILCSCSSATFPGDSWHDLSSIDLPFISTGCRPIRWPPAQHERRWFEGAYPAVQPPPELVGQGQAAVAKRRLGRASRHHQRSARYVLGTGPLYPGIWPGSSAWPFTASSVPASWAHLGGWKGALAEALDRVPPGCCVFDRFPGAPWLSHHWSWKVRGLAAPRQKRACLAVPWSVLQPVRAGRV